MLACAFDDVGGRDFDLLLANHFAEEFKVKYKVSDSALLVTVIIIYHK